MEEAISDLNDKINVHYANSLSQNVLRLHTHTQAIKLIGYSHDAKKWLRQNYLQKQRGIIISIYTQYMKETKLHG